MGLRQIGENWINPYVSVLIPRSGSTLKDESVTTLGLLSHRRFTSSLSDRLHFELAIRQQGGAKDSGARVDFTTSGKIAYRNLVLGFYEHWNLTDQFKSDARVSVSGSHDKLQGFAEVDFENLHDFKTLTLGANFRWCKKLGFYAKAIKSLTDIKETPEVHFGADYQHCTGFGVKSALDVSRKTLSKNVNFALNKDFSGSLLFDVIRYLTLDQT